jgi:hypothetical protein
MINVSGSELSFLTRNMEKMSRRQLSEFALYRVFDFAIRPCIFEIRQRS